MKKLIACAGVALLMAVAAPALAQPPGFGTMDDVPAGTLLLPYFQVDLSNADGIDTLFSINNASSGPELAHVVVWSQWSSPVLDFDVYLTGWDVQTINLRDVFVSGCLPSTGPAIGIDGKGHVGSASNTDVDYGGSRYQSCAASPPNSADYSPGFGKTCPSAGAAISGAFKAHIQAALTGQVSPSTGGCYGWNYGDNVARGYITIDTVTDCNLRNPQDATYLTTDLAPDNALWGDYFYVDTANAFAQGNNLIAIQTVGPGPFYWFYGRYAVISNAGPYWAREGLANAFGVRYLNGGAFTGGTNLQVWRDSKDAAPADGMPLLFGPDCNSGTIPSYVYDSNFLEASVTVFDEDENPVTTGGPSGQPGGGCVFCDETQQVKVGTDLDTGGFNFGWIYMDLDHTEGVVTGGPYDGVAQGWVTATDSALGQFSVGLNAVQLHSVYCGPAPSSLGPTTGVPYYLCNPFTP